MVKAIADKYSVTKKQFLVTVKYPSGDRIASEEFIDVITEAIDDRMESLPGYLDANIMDGESNRLITTVEEMENGNVYYGELSDEEIAEIKQIEEQANDLLGYDNKYSVALRQHLSSYKDISDSLDVTRSKWFFLKTEVTKRFIGLFCSKGHVDVLLSDATMRELRFTYASKVRRAYIDARDIISKLKSKNSLWHIEK